MLLRQFHYLLAVEEERHFGRAAERCNVAQSSLSTGIKQLELELGTRIVLRGRGKHFGGLTPEGSRVAIWARSILANCNSMRYEGDLMHKANKRRVRIGAIPSMSPILPVLCEMFHDDYRGVQIDVEFVGNRAMKLGLNNFTLDVGLAYLDSADLGRKNALSIFGEQLSLLVPDVPAFRRLDAITWSAAAELPLAMLPRSTDERRFVDRVFAKCKRSPIPRVESDSIAHLMFQVQYTELCTIIPSHFIRAPGLYPGTRALPLVDPIVGQEIGLFWAEGEVVLPMAGAFVTMMRKLSRSGELRRRLESAPAAEETTTVKGNDEGTPSVLVPIRRRAPNNQ